MAEIFVPPDNPESYLQTMYQRAFWRALVEHAPSVLEYLREHGAEAWLERYGLPREPWYQVGVDYLEAPHSGELRNFWYSDQPPKTPCLSDYVNPKVGYDPEITTVSAWRARIEQYIADVERAYTEAGWQRVRVKTNIEHTVWLALRLEGYSYSDIADHLKLVVDDDAIRKGVQAMAELLKIKP